MENNLWENIRNNSQTSSKKPSDKAWYKLNSLLDQQEENATTSKTQTKWLWLSGIAASLVLLLMFNPKIAEKSNDQVYVFSMEQLNIDQIDNSPLYAKDKIRGLYKAYKSPRIH